jgi:hypothetical protein
VKRMRTLTVLGTLAVALPLGLQQGVAQAGSSPSVTIDQYAEYIFASSVIDVGLNVTCTGGGGSGEVVVNVTQSPPASPDGGASGSGTSSVVCDGRTHAVAVSVTGFGFGAGDASATADLMVGLSDVAHDQRAITIIVTH